LCTCAGKIINNNNNLEQTRDSLHNLQAQHNARDQYRTCNNGWPNVKGKKSKKPHSKIEMHKNVYGNSLK